MMTRMIRQQFRLLVLTERNVLAAHASWMSWNLLLALVPLLLAILLFRPGRRRTPLWWTGALLFVGFLPNAPYVLTDAIHLIREVQRIGRPSALLAAVLSLYGVFFIAGFACYVAALVRLSRYLHAEGRAFLAVPAEATLQTLAAVGVFLGRFDRLNSWDVLAHPGAVVSAVGRLAQHRPLLSILLILAVVVAVKAASLSAARAAAPSLRSLHARIAQLAALVRNAGHGGSPAPGST
jgi:uncharacterized membrane protein